MNRRTLLLGGLILGVIIIAWALFLNVNRGMTTFMFTQQFSAEQFECNGKFEIPVIIKNPLTTSETVNLSLRNLNNVENASLSTQQINLNGGAETVIEVFGKLTRPCGDGSLRLLAGGNRISGLFEIEAQAVAVLGTGPDGRTPDNMGVFDFSNPNPQLVTYTCCGVGFAGNYKVEFLPSENITVTNLVANPTEFDCAGQENHTVNITGKLRNLASGGFVRVRAKSPRDFSCRVITSIEPAQ